MTEPPGNAEPASGSARYLLNLDGSCFDDLTAVSAALEHLPDAERIAYRDSNATEIACAEAARMLLVAGPGAGKSHLFISRIVHWIEKHGDKNIYVSTFVRKLIQDLEGDIKQRLSEDDQTRVQSTTLHTLARSLLERNGGVAGLPFGKYIRIIDRSWTPVVWCDALAFHPDLVGSAYTSKNLDGQFHTELLDDSSEWTELRATYARLCQFYNAVGFSNLIALAQLAVAENPALNEHQLWIIDEYQDFNPSEDHLIRNLTDGADAVLLAGDDEQALYQTLKASNPDIVIGHYNNAAVAKAMLPFCSRCSYHVCRAASAFISNHRSDEAIEKIYLPLNVRETAPRVQIVATAAPGSAVDYIRKFLEDHSTEYAEYIENRKSGRDSDPFLLILGQSGGLTLKKAIPAEKELEKLVAEASGEAESRSADYMRVTNYALAGWYENDNFAVRKLLHQERLKTDEVHELIAEAMKSSRTLGDVVAERHAEAIRKARAVALHLAETDGVEDQAAAEIDGLIGLADVTALAREITAHPIRRASARDEEDEEAIETVAAVLPVALMAITGSKGLSAHHVVVLGCDDLNLGKTTPLAFFVALTRARESLHLIVSAKAGGSKSAHPFVCELPSDCCDYLAFKKTGRAIETLADIGELQKRLAVWGSYRRNPLS